MLCVTRFLKLADWFAAVTAVNGDHVSGGFCRLFCHGLSDQWTVRREARTVCLIRCLLLLFFFYIRSTFSVHNLTSIFPIVSFRLLLFSFLFMFLQTAHTATGRNRGPGVFPGTRWDVDRQSPRSNSSPSGVEKTGSSHNPAVIHAVSTLSGPPCSLSLTRLFLSPWKRSHSSQSRNFRRGFLVLNCTLPPYLCHLAFRLESSDCNVLER